MTIFLRGLFVLVAVVELRWALHVTLGAGLIAGFAYSAPLEDLKITT